MYLDYGSSDRITLSVITDGSALSSTRQWNVRVQYLECNSLSRGSFPYSFNWVQNNLMMAEEQPANYKNVVKGIAAWPKSRLKSYWIKLSEIMFSLSM